MRVLALHVACIHVPLWLAVGFMGAAFFLYKTMPSVATYMTFLSYVLTAVNIVDAALLIRWHVRNLVELPLSTPVLVASAAITSAGLVPEVYEAGLLHASPMLLRLCLLTLIVVGLVESIVLIHYDLAICNVLERRRGGLVF